MDAYFGYSQIRMDLTNEDKTSLIIERANFCYQVRPFDLKNAEATYQRLINKVFSKHIRKNMEVYIDDMVAKTMRKKRPL